VAHVPRRRAEPQLTRGLALPLLLSLAAPRAAAGQQEGGARAGVEAALKLSSVRGDATVFAGGVGLIDLGRRVAFGAGAWLALSTVRISTGRPETDKSLRMAYAGVVAEGEIRRGPDWVVNVRALVGAGNAKVSDRLIGVPLGADNFGVVEPEVGGSWHLGRGAWLTGGLGYRFTFGVEDLPDISEESFRGMSLRMGIALRSF
jgi:hypothetical protein